MNVKFYLSGIWTQNLETDEMPSSILSGLLTILPSRQLWLLYKYITNYYSFYFFIAYKGIYMEKTNKDRQGCRTKRLHRLHYATGT